MSGRPEENNAKKYEHPSLDNFFSILFSIRYLEGVKRNPMVMLQKISVEYEKILVENFLIILKR